MAQTDDKRFEGKIDAQEQNLQAAERASKNKHLAGTVIKNTAVNLFDHFREGIPC